VSFSYPDGTDQMLGLQTKQVVTMPPHSRKSKAFRANVERHSVKDKQRQSKKDSMMLQKLEVVKRRQIKIHPAKPSPNPNL